jgi:capsular exopolysaccharide synthesis family protein
MAHLQRKRRASKEQVADDFSGRLVAVRSPGDGATEAFRTLRTNILYALLDTSPKVIVVTSTGPKEGKSTICANLGVLLAQADKSTLILDCDFRKPAMHKIFGLPNVWGVVDVLVGEPSLQEIWQEPLPGLKVGTAGSIPPNPAELLGSERLPELLNQTRQEFDYVLLDAPPTQMFSDPMILSTQSEGVLLVIDSQNTRKGSVKQSIRSLKAVGANVLGTVMNNVETPKAVYYRYGYTDK